MVAVDSKKELTTAAERLRESFTETDHFTTQGLVNITISIGGSYASPAKKSSPNTLFSSADQSLHQAKRAGRNRVVIAG
ncbi:MAG: diguanylate cyclase [gamma proteobacterium endosymbiont of Lamellibrachia anaximandri]|nr:diguanylate cyclase [gamma proteobacterium endosymbiont of Lamellibrachia anaximandri]